MQTRLAPPCQTAEDMLALAVESIGAAGLTPRTDISLGVDVASSHFYRNGRYELGKQPLESLGMIERLTAWVQQYPIISVEDGLAEDDWQHWPELNKAIAMRAKMMHHVWWN